MAEVYPPPSERRIIFGDGFQAQLEDSDKSKKDPDSGEELITFKMKPLAWLKWKYKITDDKYTNKVQWYIEKSYPRDKCICINESPKMTTWIVLLTYDGRPGFDIEAINRSMELRAKEYKRSYDLLAKLYARSREELRLYISQPDVMDDKLIQQLDKLFKAGGVTPKQSVPPREQEEGD